MHFYADAPTRELLASAQPTVFLYGGFEGFDNYGDVLQLKGAIAFHRQYTGMAPVIVVSMAAWTWAGLLARLLADYDVAGVIFEEQENLDAAELGLEVIREVYAGALLHIYGGGYFTEFWGGRRAYVCEQLIFRLHIGEYLISGIQVDDVGAVALRDLFAKKQPLLVGARDRRSQRHLARIASAESVRFSFDDSLEPIERMRDTLARFGGAEPTRRSIGLHLNLTSEYTSASQGSAAERAVSTARAAFPMHDLTLLSAYNDRRRVVVDTFAGFSVLQVADRQLAFEAVDLAAVAVRRILTPTDVRHLATALGGVDIVISASYHVALTMHLLGRPAFLIASNDYYRHKRCALELADDLPEFLSNPRDHLRDFAVQRRRRLDWLEELRAVVNGLPGWREPAAVDAPPGSPVRTVLEKYATA